MNMKYHALRNQKLANFTRTL